MATPILIIAGVGHGGGTGAAVARKFANIGYKVALVSRNADSLKQLASDIESKGGVAGAFPVTDYSSDEIHKAFESVKGTWKDASVRVAVWNAGNPVWGKFLDIKDEQVVSTVEGAVYGPWAFSRESILAFKELDLDKQGTRGTLIFTGATAAIRGNVLTSAFAAGKFASRALSQSLAKTYGPENIHVVHAVIDGGIQTDKNHEPVNPDKYLQPDAIADAYVYLSQQHRSAYTWELDLRPAHEKW